jgi:G-patch domain/R3H domain
MDKFSRKIVHTLAQAYHLDSHSQGSGRSRFTTLFKPSTFSDSMIDEYKINGILKRTLRIRHTEQSWDGRSSAKGVKKHKDGDVVGGDAKEIASDNRGRVMLEKLGWRSGMGLGVEGMGMKVPVFAVVKASKSGLQ